jgi:uncharacterized damage-inducible protein DinB
MPYTVQDAAEGLNRSREFFLKHIKGLTDEQWDWKPYPECKSIRETVAHLIIDDRAALQSLQSGKEPDYESLTENETDRDRLLALLAESHEALCGYILAQWKDAPLDTMLSVWGMKMPIAAGLGYMSSEDNYHAGQVAFIRSATDPSWDYYAAIYGAG